MDVAFIGLGNMGAGMAHRLMEAGHRLIVWNRTAAKWAPFVALGAVAAENAAAAAAAADLVISSLMDDASVLGMFGPGKAALAAMRPGAVHVCVTTISPGCAEILAVAHAAQGSRYVSGPVLGRPDAARAGTLMQLFSGDLVGIEAAEPVCRAFAPVGMRLAGPAGVANKQKLCLNFVIAAMLEVVAESYVFAEKIGASPEMMGMFFGRVFAFPGLQQYAARMLARENDAADGFAMTGGAKDLGLMLAEARAAGMRLEIAELVEEKMRAGIAAGMGGMDWSAMQEMTRERAGLENKVGG